MGSSNDKKGASREAKAAKPKGIKDRGGSRSAEPARPKGVKDRGGS